jgi:hypothetical protein
MGMNDRKRSEPKKSSIVVARAVAAHWDKVTRALRNGFTMAGIAEHLKGEVGVELSVEAVRKAVRRKIATEVAPSPPAPPSLNLAAEQPVSKPGRRSAAALLLGEPTSSK